MEVFKEYSFNWKNVSWDKALKIVTILQKYLFRSVYIEDLKTSLKLQKIILCSNSSRLLAIRYVTQLCPLRKISGVDSRVVLSFLERFELNEFLKHNLHDWFPQSLKYVSISRVNGEIFNLQVSTIADRAWQYLLFLAIEPAHKALSSPYHFFSSSLNDLYFCQRIIIANLDKTSYGFQKRILKLEITKTLDVYNKSYLIQRIIAPRSIKLGLNRLLNKGFQLECFDSNFNLSRLLFNILLSEISKLGRCLFLGYLGIYFLKPIDNELFLINNLYKIFNFVEVKKNDIKIKIISINEGFDFLGWHFKTLRKKYLLTTPSVENYQKFLTRVKHIINNSNYGSNIKANKLYPIVKEWKLYQLVLVLYSNYVV